MEKEYILSWIIISFKNTGKNLESITLWRQDVINKIESIMGISLYEMNNSKALWYEEILKDAYNQAYKLNYTVEEPIRKMLVLCGQYPEARVSVKRVEK